jgi:hypothetical protein
MGDNFIKRLTLAFFISLAVSGCGSQGSSPGVPAMVKQSQQSSAVTSGSIFYVINPANTRGSVLTFASNANGNVRPTVRLRGLRTGLGFNSRSVATDKLGRLYATGSHFNLGKIYIWRPGSNGNVRATAFFTACSNDTGDRMVLAVDPSDHLWVACRDESRWGIVESREMLLEYPQIRADATGDIGRDYPPLREIRGEKTGLAAITTIAFDLNGEVSVQAAHRTIATFARDQNGNVAPIARLGGRSTLLDGGAFGYDSQGRLIACTYRIHPDSSRAHLITFAAGASGNVAPISTLKVNDCYDYFAIDPKGGNIYTVLPYAITEYAAGATGSAQPIRVISGGLTGLTDAASIAF